MSLRRRVPCSAHPRARAAAGALLALAFVATSALLFVRSANDAQRSLTHIQVSLGEPLGHLAEALEANMAGEALLQRAVLATGDERNELLSQSIAMAETAARAWTSYRRSAPHLPGEAELASKYQRDYEAGKAIAGRVLVPILQSSTPMPLPAEQIVAADLNRQNLIALQSVYEREAREALGSLSRQQDRETDRVLIAAAALEVMLLIGSGLALRAAHRTAADRRQQTRDAELDRFEGRLVKALEFADSDDDVFRVASRALSEAVPDVVGSILVVDAGLATLTPTGAPPACAVQSAELCRASRAGVPLQFSDSDELDTCPVLAAGATTACAVTCIPVSVAGAQAAVVQLTGPVGTPPDVDVAVSLIVRRVGDRLTTMRALSQFQLQASHDPLTGLLNRRSLEEAVDRLTTHDLPYAVAFADLDHFKRLNDVYGHDVGDRALRAFAATLKTSLRPDDLIGRWGGEEFVILLPDCGQQQAIEAMDRVRAQLAADALEGSNVAVTVSVGIAVRQPSEPFDHAIARADHALHRAKEGGRDRVEAWAPKHHAPDAATACKATGTSSLPTPEAQRALL